MLQDDSIPYSVSKRVKDSDLSDTSSESTEDDRAAKMEKMSQAFKTILECLGEDTDREGLRSTPMRAAKALAFFTQGYCQTVEEVVGEGVFVEETDGDMIVVRNIDIHSLCEHHMVPFSGKVHIAYIPNGKILGLSKLARIAEVFGRRLQVQERLTRQIAQAIMEAVDAKGVGVVIEASHMCMVMRGVEKAGSSTVTSSVLGSFKTDKQTRAEFFSLVNSTR
ncbi:GTP cyclohydrolase 1 [Ochromonadaceae sp. CCMP2298]|nr:GTP cyclohydrolase 1 [Ochromonadaceae sp. CCMP2298]|eukprot:CAMPEP_0173182670 /NCGR_PEP_ID=MMETSP1141-20130122/7972_1 /TAXON_ID=483371 /ORGANISM="non described non described, Strain CCMP2298" /LENGTH=221 /DNA_ID=CAMNT_0014105801 /DNA_START=219 /DNA_END=884 /DNA_ORIENTATION=-